MIIQGGILLGSSAPTAVFYGWEVFQYIHYILDAYVKQFPWQVRISFIIIGLCVFTMAILFSLFLQKVIKRQQQDKLFEQCREKFEKPFREILSSQDKLGREEMEYICKFDGSQMQEFDGSVMTRLMVSLRMEKNHQIYIPNLQRLCNICGVQSYLENNLIKRKDVEQSLQILMTLPIRVSEGALAAYTSHKDSRVYELARSYFGFCSKTEPFSFVTQDVNKPFNLWYPTTFHRLCGWHNAKGHPMPHFLTMINHSTNEDKKALFIAEIPYWGTDEEKYSLRSFVTSANPKCCSASIHALALIGDPASEEYLISNYDSLFPAAKRETLRAVAKINTGKQTEFFKYAYLHSTSHNTRAVALSCLFNYGTQGKRAFYELSHAGLDDNRFFEQIISSEDHTNN